MCRKEINMEKMVHKNGEMWYDVDGNPIQAHGGCIINHKGKWYWYGEHKGQDNVPGTTRVDVIGVSCYSSNDLVNWKYEGLALAADNEDPKSMIHPSCVLERPKVIYNEKTGKFALWFHSDSANYLYARVGIAVSDSPTGPFKLLATKRPNNHESRDMTVYKDTDGVAYAAYSSDHNRTMHIARLTDDYLDLEGSYVAVMEYQTREAPAICKRGGLYYMVTSGCTGWNPNSALYSQSPKLMSQWWRLMDNPCEGENYRRTFEGQSAYIFENDGKQYLMLDHWKPNDLKTSGYSILPITYEGNVMRIIWQDTWEG